MSRRNDYNAVLDQLGDSELVRLTRDGSASAYATLWKRHSSAAFAVAYAFTTLEADDIVAEAYTRVLASIQNGNGPDSAFRSYVATTVRNVARRWSTTVTGGFYEAEFDSMVDPTAANGEEEALREMEKSVVATAFRSLPTRWQEVLWYSEVDGLKPRELAVLLGIKSNAASALVFRAKQGFRDAWISGQIMRASTPDCMRAINDMGPYTRDALTTGKRKRLEAHLATCMTCPQALQDARTTASNLALVLLPLAVGLAGAAAYNAAGAPQSAVASQTAGLRSASKRQSLRTRRRLLLALLVLVSVGAVASAASWPAVEPDSAGDLESPATRPAPGDAPTMPSSTPDTAPPTDAAPEPVLDAPTPPAGPEPSDTRGSVGATSPPLAPGQPTIVAPAAPAVRVSQDTARRFFPVLSGDDAQPGAKIDAIDGTGTTVGTTRADLLGRWSLTADSGVAGSHTVAARQTVDGLVSPLSASATFDVVAGPQITSPITESSQEGAMFLFSFTGAAGAEVERHFIGKSGLQTIRVPTAGDWSEYLSVDPGTYTMTLRYSDLATGRFGPATSVTFSAS